MGNSIKNQSGFAVVEGILILVIVGILGFTGWYVVHAKNNADKSLQSNSSTTPVYKKKATATSPKTNDETAGWKTYTSPAGHYSLKYPTTWFANIKPSECDAGTLFMIGSDKTTAGTYCSEGVGEASFDEIAKGQVACSDYQFKSSDYTGITTDAVTISGVGGTKQVGITKADNTLGVAGIEANLKAVTYCLTGKSAVYLATYLQVPGHADASDTFSTIVTKTLQLGN